MHTRRTAKEAQRSNSNSEAVVPDRKFSSMRISPLASVVALILQMTATAWGQSTVQQPAREENLSEKIINPIAFLRMTLENKYSPSLWDTPGEENQVEGEWVIPSKIFAKPNLARTQTPFRYE
jgi:hypothetical protein